MRLHRYLKEENIDLDFDPFREEPDPWAEYALLSSCEGRLSLEFRRVNFDVVELIDVYRTSGRPNAETAIAQYTD